MYKNRIYVVVVCLLLCGCFSHHALMTQQSFDSIHVGSSIQTVVDSMGEPYSIHEKNGMEEYKYVERVTNGNYLIYENHYTIFVKNGTIVGKTRTQEQVPAFDLIYQDDPNHNQYP